MHFVKFVKNLMIKFGDVLKNELLKELLSNRLVDHKIELIHSTQPLSKTPYKLNQIELSEFKKKSINSLKRDTLCKANSYLVS